MGHGMRGTHAHTHMSTLHKSTSTRTKWDWKMASDSATILSIRINPSETPTLREGILDAVLRRVVRRRGFGTAWACLSIRPQIDLHRRIERLRESGAMTHGPSAPTA
eukprot:scaffold3843_cov117-Isochrysis_galbana.AAC.6